MPRLLTTKAIITCPHGGQGTTIPTTPILSVEGGYALAEGDAGTLTCPFPYPCVGYTLRSMGLNATRIADRKAILETDFQQTQTGLPLTIRETQTSAIDGSVPADVLAGADGDAVPEALDDSAEPVVEVAPPTLAFNSNTMMPATATATFTLASDHPLEWRLTLINPVAQSDRDLTGGAPPGAVVTPAGGGWETTTLTVTLTLTAAFMAGLGTTTGSPHEFFLTAINRRGRSGYGRVALTVA